MDALLVVKTKNGYASAPYAGELPANFVAEMEIANKLRSYSYGEETVLAALERHFEPEPVVQLKEAA